MIRKKDIILSLLSGILLIFAFPPFDFYPLAWIALAPLLISLWEKNTKASFVLGMITGLVYFTGTIYWIFNSMYHYGHVPAVLSLLLLLLLCLYLGTYVGIFSMIFNSLSQYSRFPALFLVPVIWVTLEFLRTYALTGFPWSVLGYSQYKFLTLIQISDLTGVYGVSFLIAALNGAVYDVLASWPKKMDMMPLFGRWPMTVGLIVLAVIVVLSISYGMYKLNAEDKGEKIRVSVIQGNFGQDKKWDRNYRKQIMNTYKNLTIQAAAESPDLIVWPESAIPFVFNHDTSLTEEVIEFQKELGSYLLFGGIMVKDTIENKNQLSNSAILLSHEGTVLSTYDKIHLVPYGEYVPLKRFFPFIKKMVVGIGDYKPGEEYTVMDIPPARISSPICYEIIFPGLVRKFAEKGANLFVTVTNDAWFGRTSAPYQHFSMAVFRAVENRVPVVRAANTGISGFIDAHGRIKSKSDIFVEAVLTENLTLGALEKSFYAKYGDLFVFLCIISFVLLVANVFFPGRKRIITKFS